MCSPKYENLEKDEVWVIRGGGGWGVWLWKVTEKMQWGAVVWGWPGGGMVVISRGEEQKKPFAGTNLKPRIKRWLWVITRTVSSQLRECLQVIIPPPPHRNLRNTFLEVLMVVNGQRIFPSPCSFLIFISTKFQLDYYHYNILPPFFSPSFKSFHLFSFRLFKTN